MLALTAILALITYLWMSFNVGKARGRFGVAAPAISGNADFERYYRVQMNTLEQLVIFLPSLWLFAMIWDSPKLASALGAVWIVGRIIYAQGYYIAAEKRGPGFLISGLSTVILLFGSLAGVLMRMAGH